MLAERYPTYAEFATSLAKETADLVEAEGSSTLLEASQAASQSTCACVAAVDKT